MKTVIAAAALFLFLQATCFAQPAIHIDRPTHDFETVGQQDKVEHIFEIQNAGDEELLIERLVPS